MPDYTDEEKRIMFRTRSGHRIIEKFVTNKYPVDGAPGGFRNTMQAFQDADNEHFNARHYYHAFIPAISALALNTDDYFYNFGAVPESVLLSETPFDKLYFPTGDIEDINQEHVWVSFELADNIMEEIIPQNILLNGRDWTQGEIKAQNGINITNGFHASADNPVHIHLGNLDKSLLQSENWTAEKSTGKIFSFSQKNINGITTQETDNITIYPNPANGIFNVNVKKQSSINDYRYTIKITDLTEKIVFLQEKNGNNFTVNINDKPNGIYILKILYDNKIISRKIIKQ